MSLRGMSLSSAFNLHWYKRSLTTCHVFECNSCIIRCVCETNILTYLSVEARLTSSSGRALRQSTMAVTGEVGHSKLILICLVKFAAIT